MKIILDTHIFLWYVEGDRRCSDSLREIIEVSSDTVYLSIASLWEIAIKTNLGKLELTYEFTELLSILKAIDIQLLNIVFEDLVYYQKLPLHHRDPFDRLIISQVQNHGHQLVSQDVNFRLYDVELISD